MAKKRIPGLVPVSEIGNVSSNSETELKNCGISDNRVFLSLTGLFWISFEN